MTNNEIEQIALQVLEKYVDRGGGYKQFAKIMEAEGIRFEEEAFEDNDFLGVLTFKDNEQPYIIINSNIPNAGRRNFTIAHELGHFFLNHRLHSPSFICYDNYISEEAQVSKKLEHEANYFASCFLIPEQKIVPTFIAYRKKSRIVEKKGILYVNKDRNLGFWLSFCKTNTKRFGVSEAALKYRMSKLDLVRFGF